MSLASTLGAVQEVCFAVILAAGAVSMTATLVDWAFTPRHPLARGHLVLEEIDGPGVEYWCGGRARRLDRGAVVLEQPLGATEADSGIPFPLPCPEGCFCIRAQLDRIDREEASAATSTEPEAAEVPLSIVATDESDSSAVEELAEPGSP